MNARLAILETSHRSGWVALGLGEQLLSAQRLNESRRHARDLVPMLAALLAEQGWKPRDLDGVIVSRGPGSYTGLRVGVMSAKTLSYATGCALLAVDTFAAIAVQAPPELRRVAVIADAQQDKVYWQRFTKQPITSLQITSFADWMTSLTGDEKISGPGLEVFGSRLPADRLLPQEVWLPKPESLLKLGFEKLQRGERDDPFALEPLYLRPSSAEEKLHSAPV